MGRSPGSAARSIGAGGEVNTLAVAPCVYQLDCARLALVPGLGQAGRCPLCVMYQHVRTA